MSFQMTYFVCRNYLIFTVILLTQGKRTLTNEIVADFMYAYGGLVSMMWWSPGVGVIKPISSIPLFSQIFNIKTHVKYWISY